MNRTSNLKGAAFATQVRLRVACSILLMSLAWSVPASGQDFSRPDPNNDLALAADWQVATAAEIASAIGKWSQDRSLPVASRSELERQLQQLSTSPELPPGRSRLELVLQLLGTGDPRVVQVQRDWELPRVTTTLPQFSEFLRGFDQDDLARNHLQLLMGRWLVQNDFYDEALELLNELSIDDVLDRESLLFYRAVAQHELLEREACLATVARLLQQRSAIPERFALLAQRMSADLQPLESDSLDEVSRLMGDIGRRTRLNRSGEKVLAQEQTVIRKLDQLIQDLEARQQATPAAVPGGSGSGPMQDSMPLADKGDGQVPSKLQLDGGQWGNLPPAKRAAALAEMTKSMPPHYRAAIEEYFRRLAAEDQR